MKIIGVIPARYRSSRFPGKPLVDIHGKPMIQHVYERSIKSTLLDEIYVATDDERIYAACEEKRIPAIMTSELHPTGTDRVAEVAERVEADIYVNIQGDEPLISPASIDAAVKGLMDCDPRTCSNLIKKIENMNDLIDTTVPKVVVNDDFDAVFLSRQAIPYPKGSAHFDYYKQICVYAFSKESISRFKALKQSRNELAEEIELLRFIDNRIAVRMIEVFEDTIAVDVPSDVVKVTEVLRGRAGND